jgi:hypothetical protein
MAGDFNYVYFWPILQSIELGVGTMDNVNASFVKNATSTLAGCNNLPVYIPSEVYNDPCMVAVISCLPHHGI